MNVSLIDSLRLVRTLQRTNLKFLPEYSRRLRSKFLGNDVLYAHPSQLFDSILHLHDILSAAHVTIFGQKFQLIVHWNVTRTKKLFLQPMNAPRWRNRIIRTLTYDGHVLVQVFDQFQIRRIFFDKLSDLNERYGIRARFPRFRSQIHLM